MTDYTTLFREMNIPTDNVDSTIDSAYHDAKRMPRETLEALKNGSHDAYTEVFTSYHASIKNFLTKILRSEEDAQEITQNVFFQLWQKRSDIDPDKNIKGFLYTTARFYILSYFRHKRVETRYENYFVSEKTSDSPDEICIEKELHLLADIAIAKMPQQQKTVFRMKFDEGKSTEEIAMILNIKPETVRVHLSRGKHKIKEILMGFLLFITLQ